MASATSKVNLDGLPGFLTGAAFFAGFVAMAGPCVMGATAAGKASLAVEAWWMRPSGGENGNATRRRRKVL